jgi:hypothetical protein
MAQLRNPSLDTAFLWNALKAVGDLDQRKGWI